MKICGICKISKSLDEYYNSKARKDGVQSACKACSSNRSAEIYQEKKEIINARTKRYYQANKKELKTKSRNRYTARKLVDRVTRRKIMNKFLVTKLNSMSNDDQNNIKRIMKNMLIIRGVCDKRKLELIYKLGTWINENDPRELTNLEYDRMVLGEFK